MSAKQWQRDLLFAVGCALAYAAAVLVIRPYTPLLEPDSGGYISFAPYRSAFYPAFLYLCRSAGLSLVETTWVQLALFATAFVYLLRTLMRVGFPKPLLAIMTAVLAGNILFSSFHRTILTESLYFTVTLMTIAQWIDYFRTGRVVFIALAGLTLGVMIGIRLAAVGLLPIHLLAVWLRRPISRRRWTAAALAVLMVGVTAGAERVLTYSIHGNKVTSIAPYLLFGKAAMLIRPGMKFSGPHARTLESLGARLEAIYGPVQRDVENAPSLPVRIQLGALYESTAQYSIMTNELAAAARRQKMSGALLREDLGRQVLLQNPIGYLKLTLLHALGQWSIAAARFPPTARAMSAYADTNPGMTLGGRIPEALLHPTASRTSWLVYPAFLVAGAVTFVLTFGAFLFVVRPDLASGSSGFYLLIATFLSAMCHCYTLFISIVNLATPRYLMAVFPQLEIIALCLIMALTIQFKRVAERRRHAPTVSADPNLTAVNPDAVQQVK